VNVPGTAPGCEPRKSPSVWFSSGRASGEIVAVRGFAGGNTIPQRWMTPTTAPTTDPIPAATATTFLVGVCSHCWMNPV